MATHDRLWMGVRIACAQLHSNFLHTNSKIIIFDTKTSLMASLNSECHKNHSVKEKLTFNDVADFEIMQVKTQMICNG